MAIKINRYFTNEELSPFDMIKWKKMDAEIKRDSGESLFQQKDIETPESWSQQSINIVSSRYFYGKLGSKNRESSIRQLVSRVADTITLEGIKQHYFESGEDAKTYNDELSYILLNQIAAFNSPIWFNCGVESGKVGQAAACQPYWALVNTESGLIPIGEIVSKNMVGLRVYDNISLSKITAVKHNGKKEVLRVHLNGGFSIDVTGDHLVCADPKPEKVSENFIRVDEIEIGHFMRLYPHTGKNIDNYIDCTVEEVSEAALAGRLQGDGCAGQYKEGTNQSLETLLLKGKHSRNVRYQKVKSVEKIGIYDVYDIQTESGKYLTNNVLVHNCYINEVEDSIDSITDLVSIEGRIFKYGSGSGINVSPLRSKHENVSGGGFACFSADQKVLTSRGYIPISEIEVGVDKAITPQGSRSITHLHKNGKGDIHTVKFTDGRELNVTPNHNFIAVTSAGTIEKYPVAEILANQPNVYATLYPIFAKSSNPNKIIESADEINPDNNKVLWPFNALKLFVSDKSFRSKLSKTVMSLDAKCTGYISMTRIYDALIESNYLKDANKLLRMIEHIPAKIESIAYKETVDLYDITVAEVHQYIVNSIIVSNSGPIPFLKLLDANASTIKSGGKTRRAAKMVILDVDHPDVVDFIKCKSIEEKKAQILIQNGYNPLEATNSVYFQNSNHSVRVTDQFMHEVEDNGDWHTIARTTGDTVSIHKARDILREIAKETHKCGDPAIQFHDTFNKWHTCPNSGVQVATNPCVTGDTLITTYNSRIAIKKLYEEGIKNVKIKSIDGRCYSPSRVVCNGKKPVYKLTTIKGYSLKLTADHRIYTANNGDVPASDLTVADKIIVTINNSTRTNTDTIASLEYIGVQDVYDITEPNTSHFIANGIAVHNCSEFSFINNTSCNLASINLIKFIRKEQTEDGVKSVFDVESFLHVVRTIYIAQDIVIDPASYPTEKITEATKKYRALGLGYSNLGALLMTQGLPYDSDLGRELASAITALMTASAYLTSAELAEHMGTFSEYEKNKDPMFGVLYKHKQETDKLEASIHENILSKAKEVWDIVLKRGKLHGFRNAQATLLAPTGCLDASTLILSSEGIVPLYELGDTNGEQWQDINIDVATDTSLQKSTKFYNNGRQPAIQVTSEHGHTITGTCNHKIRIIDTNGNYVWRRLDEVKENDSLALKLGGHEELLEDKEHVRLDGVKLHDKCTYSSPPEYLNEHLSEILGYYQGNGYLKDGYGLVLPVCNTDTDLLDYLDDSLKTMFPKDITKIEQRLGCKSLSTVSKIMLKWFKVNDFDKPKGNCDGGSVGAFIPVAILRSKTSVLCAFLRGLFEANGTVYSDTSTVSLLTTSKLLADQVLVALWLLGIKSKLRIVNYDNDYKHSGRPLWKISTYGGKYIKLFQEKIGFISKRKQNILRKVTDEEQELNPIKHAGMVTDMYRVSKDLNSKVRKDIRMHMNQGCFELEWAMKLCQEYPQLRESYLYKVFNNKSIHVASVIDVYRVGAVETFDITVPETNTYIANSFVSHNTISFLMDCDTTGVEPEISLIKYKNLSEGGQIKMTNRSVTATLENLGYRNGLVRAIKEKVEEDGTFPSTLLKKKHLPIFDCSYETPGHTGVIDYKAHVKMLAAVQPFVSGSISKTINVPEKITVEEIENLYIDSWKMGLKCVAIYRENSKSWQPLVTKKGDDNNTSGKKTVIARKRLPDERKAITHKFTIAGHEGYLTVGIYENGSPGELFIVMSKEGSTISGLMDGFATSISIALQYGVPIDQLCKKFIHTRFEPSGFTSNKDIRIAKSILDYIFRWLEQKFVKSEKTVDNNSVESEQLDFPTKNIKAENIGGPLCPNCGTTMVLRGTCHHCDECGTTSGCS
ncbi:MAG: hypothetical protein GY861_22580 [bacterium]|nr:hypothetical protein [bacterium]